MTTQLTRCSHIKNGKKHSQQQKRNKERLERALKRSNHISWHFIVNDTFDTFIAYNFCCFFICYCDYVFMLFSLSPSVLFIQISCCFTVFFSRYSREIFLRFKYCIRNEIEITFVFISWFLWFSWFLRLLFLPLIFFRCLFSHLDVFFCYSRLFFNVFFLCSFLIHCLLHQSSPYHISSVFNQVKAISCIAQVENI